ncbi:uncharacterized protein B0T15DRAFT_509450 [Chaetomium strumarium]|uniref:Uncharacterized protein n=1 Tax=Chaetomium strumarium TaxID=1170767 RepID=A0AAJ0GZN9_9PEZI|nr:hypothetical protein B0T15DRAFT_509450 [Chaetomium strumarium]
MCEWEEFIFNCTDAHSELRKKANCHRARNHPRGRCTFVRRLMAIWPQNRPCEKCTEARRRAWEWHEFLAGPGQSVLADPAALNAAWQAFVQAASLNEEQAAAVTEAVSQGHCQARATNTWQRYVQEQGGLIQTPEQFDQEWQRFCQELGLNEAQAAAVWRDCYPHGPPQFNFVPPEGQDQVNYYVQGQDQGQ